MKIAKLDRLRSIGDGPARSYRLTKEDTDHIDVISGVVTFSELNVREEKDGGTNLVIEVEGKKYTVPSAVRIDVGEEVVLDTWDFNVEAFQVVGQDGKVKFRGICVESARRHNFQSYCFAD